MSANTAIPHSAFDSQGQGRTPKTRPASLLLVFRRRYSPARARHAPRFSAATRPITRGTMPALRPKGVRAKSAISQSPGPAGTRPAICPGGRRDRMQPCHASDINGRIIQTHIRSISHKGSHHAKTPVQFRFEDAHRPPLPFMTVPAGTRPTNADQGRGQERLRLRQPLRRHRRGPG